MTLAQARRTIEAARRDIRREIVWAAQRALEEARRDALAYSSGPLSLTTLRKRDHPYAKRHGPMGNPNAMPGGDPAIVNVQSGAFKSAWHVDHPQMSDSGRAIRGRISNQSQVADWLQFGTRFMVPRPIAQAVEASLASHAAEEVSRAERRLALTYNR